MCGTNPLNKINPLLSKSFCILGIIGTLHFVFFYFECCIFIPSLCILYFAFCTCYILSIHLVLCIECTLCVFFVISLFSFISVCSAFPGFFFCVISYIFCIYCSFTISKNINLKVIVFIIFLMCFL